MEKIKRIVLILTALLLIIFLCSCNTVKKETENSDDRMTIIYDDGWPLIYRDNKTGVQYIFRSYSGGCIMVDVDGKPYIEK